MTIIRGLFSSASLLFILVANCLADEAKAVPAPILANKNDQEVANLMAEGATAMRESTIDPSRSIIAFVALSRALHYYQATGDIDKICDIEANLFWCKKRMKVDEIVKYSESHKESEEMQNELKRAEAFVLADVPQREAQQFYDRARKFAAEHPTEYSQIAVKFFEVSERFVGTEIGVSAQKLSLEAQQKEAQQLDAVRRKDMQSPFSRPSTPHDNGKLPNIPSPDQIRKAVISIHTLFKEEFSKTKIQDKHRLAVKLLDQVAGSKDDAGMQYALLSDGLELFSATADWYSVISTFDLMDRTFAEIDKAAKEKELLSHFRSQPVVRGILALIDNPLDADANTFVGKDACFEAGKWSVGIPMLSHGSDEELKKVSDMELAVPQEARQECEIADRWFDLSKRAHAGAREKMLMRSRGWYQYSMPKLNGITKQLAIKRLDEIEDLLPAKFTGFDSLTSKQWDRINGVSISVSAGRDRTDTGVVLVHGQQICVIPNPSDTWSCDYQNSNLTVDWKGNVGKGSIDSDDLPIGSLTVQLENGNWTKPGVIEGEGRVYLAPHFLGRASSGKGSIRCKIFPFNDDEKGQWDEPFAIIQDSGIPAQLSDFKSTSIPLAVAMRGNDGKLKLLVQSNGRLKSYAQGVNFEWNDEAILEKPDRCSYCKMVACENVKGNSEAICLDGESGVLDLIQFDAHIGWSISSLSKIIGSQPPFSDVETTIGSDGNLQVLGIGKLDGQPYLIIRKANTGQWVDAISLKGKGGAAFSAVLGGCKLLSNFALLLLGREDGFLYILTCDGRGNWGSTEQLPNPQKIPYKNAILALGTDGYPQVIGVGRDDGQAYLIWQNVNSGVWTFNGKIVNPTQTPMGVLAAGYGKDHFLNVLCIGRDDGVPFYLWHDKQGKWSPVTEFGNVAKEQLTSAYPCESQNGDLWMVCSRRQDGRILFLKNNGETGKWQRIEYQKDLAMPASGEQIPNNENALIGNWTRADGAKYLFQIGGKGFYEGHQVHWTFGGGSYLITYSEIIDQSDEIVLTGSRTARIITKLTGKIQVLSRDEEKR